MTTLKQFCKFSKKELFSYLQQAGFVLQDGYAFKNNGSKVLGVAHLDVAPSIEKYHKDYFENGNLIVSPALDDRLGIYILLEVLPGMGIEVDVLITDFEEIGQSTASNFKTTKEYNWMFQFDRSGTDVVMYQYDNKESRNMLHEIGFRVGIGSFSDICSLDHLGIVGFNFGTAYYREHSQKCYANLEELAEQIELFRIMFLEYSETKMVYDDVCSELWYDDVPDYVFDKSLDSVENCEYCGWQHNYTELSYFPQEDVILCTSCINMLGLSRIMSEML